MMSSVYVLPLWFIRHLKCLVCELLIVSLVRQHGIYNLLDGSFLVLITSSLQNVICIFTTTLINKILLFSFIFANFELIFLWLCVYDRAVIYYWRSTVNIILEFFDNVIMDQHMIFKLPFMVDSL